MNIEENEAQLTAYALGELSGKELTRIEAELEKSPEARQEVEEIRRAAELLSGEFGKHGELTFSDRQREKVLRAGVAVAVAEAEEKEDAGAGTIVRPDAFSRFSRWMGVSAAAACVVFVGVMGVKQFSQDEAEDLAASERQAKQQQGLRPGADFERAELLPATDAKGDKAAAGRAEGQTLEAASKAPKNERAAPFDDVLLGEPTAAPKPAEPIAAPAESLRRSQVFDQAIAAGDSIESISESVAPGQGVNLDDSMLATGAEAKLAEARRPSAASEKVAPSSVRPASPAPAPAVEMDRGVAQEAMMSRLKKQGKDSRGGNAAGAGGGADGGADDGVVASGAVAGLAAPGNSAPPRQRRRSTVMPTTPPASSVTPAMDAPSGGFGGAPELKQKSKQTAESDAAAPTFGRDSTRGLKRAGGEQYQSLSDQPFVEAFDQPLSTFAIDVDTGSYTNLRRYLTRNKQLPPKDAVRVEEMINYFDYDYSEPEGDRPYALGVEVASCPWQPGHRLVKVGLKAKEMHRGERPASNLVFLVDVSGSMRSEDKLPLLKKSLAALARKVTEDDYITIVTYAGGVGVALEPTDGGQTAKIVDAIDALKSGGSTNGEGGIRKAYELAAKHFLPGGTNRVLMATDGDFNVGISDNDELVKLVQGQANQKDKPIFLTVLGFGTGNLKDARMEQIANKGNGVYFYIDGEREGQRVLVEKLSSSLVTVAKDVKLQVDFNPGKVKRYRLIGYANRRMKAEEFRDDKKDAGEMGAGHAVTALYEIEPVGADDADGAEVAAEVPKTESRYVKEEVSEEVKKQALVDSEELLTVFTRYKTPEGEKASEFSLPVSDDGSKWQDASKDFRFAASVAGFGMLLRESEFGGDLNYELLEEIAGEGIGEDPSGLRKEFVELVGKAKALGSR